LARLGDLERKVMDVLWAADGADLTVRDVAATLPSHAYTTVLTVLDRLQKKGLVQREVDGRAFRYRATASRAAYTAGLMREALHDATDSDAVLVRFAETVSQSEAEVLRGALEQARNGAKSRARSR